MFSSHAPVVTTRYRGPTATKPSSIYATLRSGEYIKRIRVSYDNAFSSELNHARAAHRLLNTMPYPCAATQVHGAYVAGSTMVWVQGDPSLTYQNVEAANER